MALASDRYNDGRLQRRRKVGGGSEISFRDFGRDLGQASQGHMKTASDAGKGVMMARLCELGNFVRGFRMRARFGELSRAPLCLLRFQLCGDAGECDWLARPPDAWDAGLPPNVGERNASQQALKDAIAVRDLLFTALPDLSTAVFRVYRRSAGDEPELIIAGSVSREERAPVTIRSLAMRAKLLGFRFWMDDGILETLQADG
jgi:hypothetical protein